MSASRFAVLLALPLSACTHGPRGQEPPATSSPAPAPAPAAFGPLDFDAGPSLAGPSGAWAAVQGYWTQAKNVDLERMLKYGTPEWRKREKTTPHRLSAAIAKKEFTLETVKIDAPVVEGDSAKVHVVAEFADANSHDHKVGMDFSLVRKDDRWWITDLR